MVSWSRASPFEGFPAARMVAQKENRKRKRPSLNRLLGCRFHTKRVDPIPTIFRESSNGRATIAPFHRIQGVHDLWVGCERDSTGSACFMFRQRSVTMKCYSHPRNPASHVLGKRGSVMIIVLATAFVLFAGEST